MTEEGSGRSGNKKLWLYLGGGCAVILLVAGILFLFGAYKGVTCCQQALERQRKARAFSVQFAEQIRDGDVESAYESTTRAYRDGTPLDALNSRLEPHREDIDGSMPMPLAVNRRIDDDDDFWVVHVGFMPKSGATFVVMKLRLVAEGEGESLKFLVDGIDFETRQRKLDKEQPARVVGEFHEHLTQGKFQPARAMMTGKYAEEGQEEAFRKFVDGHGTLLSSGEIDVDAIRYAEGRKARVEATHRPESGESTLVRYHLVAEDGVWKIEGIEVDAKPEEAGDGPTPDEPEDDAAKNEGTPASPPSNK